MRTARVLATILPALWISAAGLAAAQDQTTRISNNSAGNPGSDWSAIPALSADGRFVAFTSPADDLVPNDTNGSSDVFVYDRIAGTLERVSLANDGSEAAGNSEFSALSADGRFVAFDSDAPDLAGSDATPWTDLYVRDRVAGTTTMVSVNTAGAQANHNCWVESISSDGTRIVFTSSASNLDPSDTNGKFDVYVRDTVAGTTTLVSATQAGVVGDGESKFGTLSGDGKHVAFDSRALNFPDSTNGRLSVYVKDLDTGYLERVDGFSVGGFPTSETGIGGITHDGSIVVFTCSEPLVPEDTNGSGDAYIRDRARGVTERVSLATGGGQLTGGAFSGISGDGRFVGFMAGDDATFDDHNGLLDLFIRDRVLGITTLVSRGTLDERLTHYNFLEPNIEYLDSRWISDDGAQIVFDSDADELVSGDTPDSIDVFLRSLDRHPASSTHYGAGWPGTFGTIPTLSPQAPPYRGTILDVDVTNSAAADTTAFMFIGYARADVATSRGGSLLVDPTVLFPLALKAAGGKLTGIVPTDYWANGLVLDLQALELDPGASRGVSFTDGLELVLGDS